MSPGTLRMKDEKIEQDRRITALEENVQQINILVVSIEKMEVNMEHMLEEQKRQGERLEKLEAEPAEANKQIKMAIITTIVGLIVGFFGMHFLVFCKKGDYSKAWEPLI